VLAASLAHRSTSAFLRFLAGVTDLKDLRYSLVIDPFFNWTVSSFEVFMILAISRFVKGVFSIIFG